MVAATEHTTVQTCGFVSKKKKIFFIQQGHIKLLKNVSSNQCLVMTLNKTKMANLCSEIYT